MWWSTEKYQISGTEINSLGRVLVNSWNECLLLLSFLNPRNRPPVFWQKWAVKIRCVLFRGTDSQPYLLDVLLWKVIYLLRVLKCLREKLCYTGTCSVQNNNKIKRGNYREKGVFLSVRLRGSPGYQITFKGHYTSWFVRVIFREVMRSTEECVVASVIH